MESASLYGIELDEETASEDIRSMYSLICNNSKGKLFDNIREFTDKLTAIQSCASEIYSYRQEKIRDRYKQINGRSR